MIRRPLKVGLYVLMVSCVSVIIADTRSLARTLPNYAYRNWSSSARSRMASSQQARSSTMSGRFANRPYKASSSISVRPSRSSAQSRSPVGRPTTFTQPDIAPLTPEADRTPLKPTLIDQTSLGVLPAGVGISVPSGIPRPLHTNEWWTPGILEPWPGPVHAWPLVGSFAADGLTLTAPTAKTAGKAVVAEHKDPLRIAASASADRARAIIAGEWDVTFRLEQLGKPQFDVTLTQGSPYVFVRGSTGELRLSLPPGSSTAPLSCDVYCGSALLVRAPSVTYLLVSPARDAFTAQGTEVTVKMEEGRRLLTVAVIAPGSEPKDYLDAAMRPFTGTRATYAVSPSTVDTTFTYPVDTVFGVLPHHALAMPTPPSSLIGTYQTVRGSIRLYRGANFRTSQPRLSLIPSLPATSAVRNDEKLRVQLQAEIRENRPVIGDIYAAAKELLRVTTLVELADLVGDVNFRGQALTQARKHLANWCQAAPGETRDYLAYDQNTGGIIAIPPAFGSEQYNDHHFHYGYFLHAGAIIARHDPAFDRQLGSCMRILARDMASGNRNDPSFPYLRYFDPFGGHSWAGGTAKFNDGNNQESTSEAIHAWYAMALYGRTVGDKALEDLGTWMFTLETQAARVYWLNAEPAAPTLPVDFRYPMISILWGGKMDYATFFDGADAPIRGIQFFPATPALLPTLSRDAVARIVSPAVAAAQLTIWKSSLQMITAFYGGPTSVPQTTPLDPVYSRTYATAWMKAAGDLGEPIGSMGECAGYVFKKGETLTAAVYRFPNDPEQCRVSVQGKNVDMLNINPGWNVRTL